MAALILKTEKGYVGIPCHAIIGADLADESLHISTIDGGKVVIVKNIEDTDCWAIVDVSDNNLLHLFNMALGN